MPWTDAFCSLPGAVPGRYLMWPRGNLELEATAIAVVDTFSHALLWAKLEIMSSVDNSVRKAVAVAWILSIYTVQQHQWVKRDVLPGSSRCANFPPST